MHNNSTCLSLKKKKKKISKEVYLEYMYVCLLVVVNSSKCKLIPFIFGFQYSQKEDKYEEEIKVLTDKLKEVKFLHSHFCYIVLFYFTAYSFL